jgi:hypothetical protein
MSAATVTSGAVVIGLSRHVRAIVIIGDIGVTHHAVTNGLPEGGTTDIVRTKKAITEMVIVETVMEMVIKRQMVMEMAMATATKVVGISDKVLKLGK